MHALTTLAARDVFRLPDPGTLRAAFARDDVVRVGGAVSAQGLAHFDSARQRLWHRRFRRDLRMSQSAGSPRHMSVIGGSATNPLPELMTIYRDPDVLDWCSEVAGFEVAECPSEIENTIFTVLEKRGDTHGWHTDDYPIAFIVVLRMPDTPGGQLEVRRTGRTDVVPLRAGDVYLMRSDRLEHRVDPLAGDGTRVILNFTYARAGVEVVANGSADILCAEPTEVG